MARGIIIFGPAGSGKTTLGRTVAERLNFAYFDLDDYIWRRDTAIPFTVMYSKEEKAGRLLHDLSGIRHFVMAGSMDSFNAPFVPMFDLAVHLTACAEVRRARIRRREYELYGERILPGGDMYAAHQQFLSQAESYEKGDASPSMCFHEAWARSLPCRVLRLSGEAPLSRNAEIIVHTYGQLHSDASVDQC